MNAIINEITFWEDQLDASWEEFIDLHRGLITRFDSYDEENLFAVIWDGADYARTLNMIMVRKVSTGK